MKIVQILMFLLPFILFGQENDLKIEIINDTIKKVSYYDDCNIVYTITNKSNKDYLLILDNNEFNEADYEEVEDLFLGLPDYYLFEDNKILEPSFNVFHNGTNKIFDIDQDFVSFQSFSKEFETIYDDYELIRAFRISKKIVKIKSGEMKVYSTKVNFPLYKVRSFQMENNKKYYFQVSLNNPIQLSKKYTEKILGVEKMQFSIFSGRIKSNKVPLIYKVYNGPK